jgi:hypothetical protein
LAAQGLARSSAGSRVEAPELRLVCWLALLVELHFAASKKGEQLQIPGESLLEFRIEQPVPLPVGG